MRLRCRGWVLESVYPTVSGEWRWELEPGISIHKCANSMQPLVWVLGTALFWNDCNPNHHSYCSCFRCCFWLSVDYVVLLQKEKYVGTQTSMRKMLVVNIADESWLWCLPPVIPQSGGWGSWMTMGYIVCLRSAWNTGQEYLKKKKSKWLQVREMSEGLESYRQELT